MSAAGAFNPLDHPGAWTLPDHLSPSSTWIGHIPFAFVLIELCRPGVFVELGASHGDSYCAFCQAIASQRLPTRGFAIDTWKGDPQEGAHAPQVLVSLRQYHDSRYGDFSTLLQSD